MRSPCCLCVCECPHQFLIPELIFMKLGKYVMATEPVSTASASVCLSVYVSLLALLGKDSDKFILQFDARQRLGKHVPSATNTCNSATAERVILCAVLVLSMESLWVCLCIPLSLLGNGSVKMFPRQRIHATVQLLDVSFYVRFVS
jgi:hypothetical protein